MVTETERADAVRVQGEALRRVVLDLFAMLPADFSGIMGRVLWLAALAVLRPAESAARRIIAIAVFDVVLTQSTRSGGSSSGRSGSKARGKRCWLFRLFDPRIDPDRAMREKKVPGDGPQFGTIGVDEFRFPERRGTPAPSEEVDASRLHERMLALRAVLDDVPGHALRLARALAGGRTRWKRPMRYARPPGYRARGRREVDVVLSDCHILALRAWREHPPP